MSIDVPRVVPVHTPIGKTEDDALRVRRAPLLDRAPRDSAPSSLEGITRPRGERRVVIERRKKKEKRPPVADARSGTGRREGDHFSVDA